MKNLSRYLLRKIFRTKIFRNFLTKIEIFENPRFWNFRFFGSRKIEMFVEKSKIMIFIENRNFRLFRRKFLKKKNEKFFSNGPNSKTTGPISKNFELETGENKNFRLSTFSTHSEEAQNFMFFVYGFSRPPLNERARAHLFKTFARSKKY